MKKHLSGTASPVERSMAWLREQGWTVGKVESRDFSGKTHDLFGFADLLAFKVGQRFLLVQATDYDHVNDRVAKCHEAPESFGWRACGGQIWVVGWDKVATKAGGRKVFAPIIIKIDEPVTRVGYNTAP